MIATITITTTPIRVERSSQRRMRSAAWRVTSSSSLSREFQQLDRIAVEAGAGEQALLAAGPGGQPQLGELTDPLEAEPGERRLGGGAVACRRDRRVELGPFGLGQVVDEDRVEDDSGEAGDRATP